MQQMSELFHHMNPSILFDMHKYYPEAYKVFLKHKNGYLYNIIKENISRGIKEELYREDINLEIMTRYRLESIIIPFQPEFQQHVKSNLVEIAEQISTHFLFGMVSQKDIKSLKNIFNNNLKVKIKNVKHFETMLMCIHIHLYSKLCKRTKNKSVFCQTGRGICNEKRY